MEHYLMENEIQLIKDVIDKKDIEQYIGKRIKCEDRRTMIWVRPNGKLNLCIIQSYTVCSNLNVVSYSDMDGRFGVKTSDGCKAVFTKRTEPVKTLFSDDIVYISISEMDKIDEVMRGNISSCGNYETDGWSAEKIIEEDGKICVGLMIMNIYFVYDKGKTTYSQNYSHIMSKDSSSTLDVSTNKKRLY